MATIGWLTNRKFLAISHGVWLFYLLACGLYTINVDFNGQHYDPHTNLFTTRYHLMISFWNIAAQTVYLIVSLILDLRALKFINHEKGKFQTSNLVTFQGILYHAVLVPYTLFIVVVFWGLYWFDHSKILPSNVEALFSSFYNHFLHTLILVPIIFELLFNRIYIPSHEVNILYFNIYHITYVSTIFAYRYIIDGKWVYNVAELMTPPIRILVAFFTYSILIGFYFGYYKLEKYRWTGHPVLSVKYISENLKLSNKLF